MTTRSAEELFTKTDEGRKPAIAELLEGLNEAQREAVLHDDGPVLVLAGAGSGKTRVLTTRIARLIGEGRALPEEILAVTFTNKAAGEMRERISRMLGYEPRGMWCGTFHSLGARMLRGAAGTAGRESNFTIYDEDDALTAVKRVMEDRRVNARHWTSRMVLGAISDAKNALVTASEYADAARDPFSQAVAGVYRALDRLLERSNAVTFDDLLVLPVRALETDERLRTHFQRRFRYVLVDEYQDTNRAQYEFVALLAAAHRNLMVVGDDDQSIYGWRGADIRNILDFERGFPGARVIRLEQNYRSTPEILAVANEVIRANTERRGKTLRATRGRGAPVTIVDTLDERDEADFIAQSILDGRDRKGWSLRSCAVLYRTNAQSRALEESFRRHGLNYRLIGAVRFYDRREIRDLMAYLRLIANPSDDEAFRRSISVPRRGIGDGALEALSAYANAAGVSLLDAARESSLVPDLRARAQSALAGFASLIDRLRESASDSAVDELLRALIDEIHFIDMLGSEGAEGIERIENVRELVAGANEAVSGEGGEVGLRPLDRFLQNATLITGLDKMDPDADAVTMMTMHNAKGLEFPFVFVAGLEDGLFPLARATEDPAQLEEERRLLYVGVTRAEELLWLTSASQRRRNGELMFSVPSRFLRSIPSGLAVRSESRRMALEGRRGARALGSSRGGSSGRSFGRFSGGSSGGSYRRSGFGSDAYKFGSLPVAGQMSGWRDDPGDAGWEVENESQDMPAFVPGERVRHPRFGTGTIAETVGSGHGAKVRIDFDDEDIGRKTLVIAQARLERSSE